MTVVLTSRTRASPCHTICRFPHTQDLLLALKRGEINEGNLYQLSHPLLQELAKAMLSAEKDNFAYYGTTHEFALNVIPAPNIFPAPCLENLPDFDPMPPWMDTHLCRHCGLEIVVIKITEIAPDGEIRLSFLTIECGEIYVTPVSIRKQPVLQ